MNMSTSHGHLLSAATAALLLATLPQNAKANDEPIMHQVAMKGAAEEAGAAERIEIADFMVTLSQEAASAACHYHNGIAPEESRELLHEAHDNFALYLDGLVNGNEELHLIGKETSRRTLQDLAHVGEIWEPISGAIEVLLKNPHDKDAIALIKSQNIPLHDAANHLLSEIEGEYTNPVELTQADALMIQFSGRQATLSQKLAKESCQIWTGNSSPELMEDFDKTIRLYEATLNALRDGMPAVGIRPAPTPVIQAALAGEAERWKTVKAELLVVQQNDHLSEEAKTSVYHHLNEAMYAAKKIADLYVQHAHHDY